MAEDYKIKWEKCLEFLRDNIGEERTRIWFECARPIGFEEDRLTLALPSKFFVERYEGELFNILSSTLKKEYGENIRLIYEYKIIDEDENSKISIPATNQSKAIKSRYIQSIQESPMAQMGGKETKPEFDPQLNEALTFENYCVGESNRLPYTIAEFIAENPGKSEFNPFFLYGEVGVGKTHLIQAIGIRVKEKYPKSKVLFITLRQFQNLYANAMLKKEIPSFLNWFQQIDVLLIDDLQELSNKGGTVNVLFPIFNHLHQNGKALIFTCDRPPMELDGITDRLIDRFKWGITEELLKPDHDLKKKILSFKAARNGLTLSEEVIELIASSSTGSVRELEGIVMGIYTRSIAFNEPITLDLAKQVMKHSIRLKEKKIINFDMIVEATAEHYGLDPDLIFSKSRLRDIADARQIIMYLSHKLTAMSSGAIGQRLNRKHTTVLHGISTIEERLPYAKDLTMAVSNIEEMLKK